MHDRKKTEVIGGRMLPSLDVCLSDLTLYLLPSKGLVNGILETIMGPDQDAAKPAHRHAAVANHVVDGHFAVGRLRDAAVRSLT